jgi:RNA polymerase sigma-70 factor (ECF subfamily)
VADDGFTAFFQDAYPRVVGQLRLLTGDLASAEDAAQEAFVRAASRWRQLDRYDQPEAWVRMTAFRLAIYLLRRSRRQRRLVARLRARREPDAELHPRTGR